MGNEVLFAFMGFEALFVIGGILILVIAVITRATINGKQSVETVAHTLLLSQGPLTGNFGSDVHLLNVLINSLSRNCQRRLHLRNLPPLHSLHRRTHKSNLSQDPWIRSRLLRYLHPHPRPRNMVSNPQYPCKSCHRLGKSNHRVAIITPAEIQLLWVHECNDASLHTGQYMHKYSCRYKSTGVYWSLFFLCQFPKQQGVYGGFWHCCDRRYLTAWYCMFIEGPEGERTVCID